MSEAPKPTTPSQHQLRAKLEAMVIRDLLGPGDNPNEELTERSVHERYLVGTLPPRRQNPDDQSTVPFYDERFASEQFVALGCPLSWPQKVRPRHHPRVQQLCSKLTRNQVYQSIHETLMQTLYCTNGVEHVCGLEMKVIANKQNPDQCAFIF